MIISPGRISRKVTNRKVPAASPCSTTEATAPARPWVLWTATPTTAPRGIHEADGQAHLQRVPHGESRPGHADAQRHGGQGLVEGHAQQHAAQPCRILLQAQGHALQHRVGRQGQHQAQQPQAARHVRGAEVGVGHGLGREGVMKGVSYSESLPASELPPLKGVRRADEGRLLLRKASTSFSTSTLRMKRGTITVSARGVLLTLSLTAGRRALKHVARNTPPPKQLQRLSGRRYLRAGSRCTWSPVTCSRRTGTSTPASMRPNTASRPRTFNASTFISAGGHASVSYLRCQGCCSSWLALGGPAADLTPQLLNEFWVLLLHLLRKLLPPAGHTYPAHQQPQQAFSEHHNTIISIGGVCGGIDLHLGRGRELPHT
ncbi:LOW QUALITY PROTEIN: hypothetical protein CRUP_030722 [Coryphaenoides rupestris]|nr:LOW QUALITY PROTEIN: hypothetical protein CRUP_030722 [Coryphaenoides rupestris]